jgi:hypothetical protein
MFFSLRWSGMKDPNKTIKDAVKDAQHTLTEYTQPGERNCTKTVEKLLTTLDNNEVAEAVLESDQQEGHIDGRRSAPEAPARRSAHQH